jgi:hypothetical protein
MKKLTALLFLFCLQGFASQPTLDTYGGVIAGTCPTTAAPFYQFSGAQLFTTVTSGAITGSTTAQAITLASATESDGNPIAVGESLAIADSSTPVAVTGDVPIGGSSWTGNGTLTEFYGYLTHASVIPNTVQILVGGTVVATEQSGAIVATPTLGAAVGSVTPLLNSSRVFVHLVFSSAPASSAAITVNYSYMPTEVFQVTAVSGTSVTGVIINNHAANATVLPAYFHTGKNGNRWLMCDPLNNPYYVAGIWNFNIDTNHFHQGTPATAQDSVNTTITQAITTTGSQTVTVASTAGIIAAPGMVMAVDFGQSDAEWVTVTAVGLGTITASFAQTHAINVPLECCRQDLLAGGKYNDTVNAPVLANSHQAYTLGNIPRLKNWGFNTLFPLGLLTPQANYSNTDIAEPGLWHYNPDGSNPFKWAFATETMECSSSPYNRFSYSTDPVMIGVDSGAYFGQDFYSPYMYVWLKGNQYWNAESPWYLASMQDETDNCKGFGEGEQFETIPAYYTSTNYGAWLIGVDPVQSANYDTGAVYEQGNTFNTKLAYSQFLQGKLDPIKFPAAPSADVTSLSCSGSGVVAVLSTTWLGAHDDPFTVGELITVSGTTNFNTASGSPAIVTVAQQGSHQITLSYPTSPCPVAAESTGIVNEGPGYATVTALNSAWTGTAGGPSYTTFGSSAISYTNQAVTCSGTSCSLAGNANIEPASVQIVANYTGTGGAQSFVIAGDSPAHNAFRVTANVSTTLKAATVVNQTAITLNSYTGVQPGMSLCVNDASYECEKVASLSYSIHNNSSGGSVTGVNLATGLVNAHAASASVIAGVSAASGSVTYSTGAIALTLNASLGTGWTPTANYNTGGWGAGGTGFLDDNGTSAWYTALNADCVDSQNAIGLNGCSGATPTYGSADYQRDVDGFLQAMAGYHARNWQEASRAILRHIPFMTGYRNTGGRGGPSRPYVIRGFAPFFDILQGDFVRNDCPAGINCPTKVVCSSGSNCSGSTPVTYSALPITTTGPQNLNRMQYALYYAGDKPFLMYAQTTSNHDSGFQAETALTPSSYDGSSQIDRGRYLTDMINQAFYKAGPGGSYQNIGAAWWSTYDQAEASDFSAYGVMSENDNVYNGAEATMSPGSTANIAGFPLVPIPERSNWGDVLDWWKAAVQGVENALAGTVKTTGGASGAAAGTGAMTQK